MFKIRQQLTKIKSIALCKTAFIDDVTVNTTSKCCTRRSLPNYLVVTSYHWNMRQNILT